jgi:hypothetical protein
MFPVESKSPEDETLFGSPNTAKSTRRNKERDWLRKHSPSKEDRNLIFFWNKGSAVKATPPFQQENTWNGFWLWKRSANNQWLVISLSKVFQGKNTRDAGFIMRSE